MEMRMDILFCDLCNESVPQGDLGSGVAYYRKGRLICRDCDRAMGGVDDGSGPGSGLSAGSNPADPFSVDLHTGGGATDGPGGRAAAAATAPSAQGSTSPSAPMAPSGGGAGGVVLGLLAIVFAGTSAWLIVERMDGALAEQRERIRETLDASAGVAADQKRLERELPGRLQELSRIAAELDAERAAELLAAIEAVRGEVRGLVEREEDVAGALQALDQRIADASGRHEGMLEPLRAQLGSIEQDGVLYRDRLIELEESVRLLSAGVPAASPAIPVAGARAPAASGGASGGAQKPWAGVLPDLASDNAGIRLDAVYVLGETGDDDVVVHLIPMLEDDDLFVRMATARMLEDLDARAAVPALIDALEDEQGAVREAAVVALRNLTGEQFRFEPVGAPAERARRLQEWRDWWEKNGAAFLADS